MGELAGRSRLTDFLLRQATDIVDGVRPGNVLNYVRSYTKLWDIVVRDQGQSGRMPAGVDPWVAAPGAGKLVQMRNLGIKNFFTRYMTSRFYRVPFRPENLMVNFRVNDLYRYSRDPFDDPRLRQEIDENFLQPLVTEGVISASHPIFNPGLDDQQYVDQIVDIVNNTVDAQASTVRQNTEDGQAIFQNLCGTLARFVGERQAENNPVVAEYSSQVGMRAFRVFAIPFPIHWSNQTGWKAFFLFWNDEARGNKNGQYDNLTVWERITGVFAVWLSPRVWQNFFTKDAHGHSDGDANAFWLQTMVVFGLFQAYLYFFIAESFVVKILGWGIGMSLPLIGLTVLLLLAIAPVTYFSLTAGQAGISAFFEGLRKRVNRVSYIFGWPAWKLSHLYRQMRNDPEESSGKSYEQLLREWAYYYWREQKISTRERDLLAAGRFGSLWHVVKVCGIPVWVAWGLKDGDAREWFREFINTRWMEQPGVETFERMYSDTDFVTVAFDTGHALQFDSINAKWSQEDKDTRLHFIQTRYEDDYQRLMAYLEERYGTRGASLANRVIQNFRDISKNEPVNVINPQDPVVRQIVADVTHFFNSRQYMNYRNFQTFGLTMGSFIDMSANYFYDENFQRLSQTLTGARLPPRGGTSGGRATLSLPETISEGRSFFDRHPGWLLLARVGLRLLGQGGEIDRLAKDLGIPRREAVIRRATELFRAPVLEKEPLSNPSKAEREAFADQHDHASDQQRDLHRAAVEAIYTGTTMGMGAALQHMAQWADAGIAYRIARHFVRRAFRKSEEAGQESVNFWSHFLHNLIGPSEAVLAMSAPAPRAAPYITQRDAYLDLRRITRLSPMDEAAELNRLGISHADAQEFLDKYDYYRHRGEEKYQVMVGDVDFMMSTTWDNNGQINSFAPLYKKDKGNDVGVVGRLQIRTDGTIGALPGRHLPADANLGQFVSGLGTPAAVRPIMISEMSRLTLNRS